MPFDASGEGGGGGCDNHTITIVADIPLCSYETLEGFNYQCSSCGEPLELRHPVEARFLDYHHPPRAYYLCRSKEEAQSLALYHQKVCEVGRGEMTKIQDFFYHAFVQGWALDAVDHDEVWIDEDGAETKGVVCSTGWIWVVERTNSRRIWDMGS